jgi:hypothetical protein
VSEFLWYDGWPFYPIGALVDAKISSVWLGEGEALGGEEANLDLIFKMRDAGGFSFFEIVLRTQLGPVYGGFAGGQSLEVTDEIVNGHRVLIAHRDGVRDRFEYDLNEGLYLYTEILGEGNARTSLSSRLLKKVRARRR